MGTGGTRWDGGGGGGLSHPPQNFVVANMDIHVIIMNEQLTPPTPGLGF